MDVAAMSFEELDRRKAEAEMADPFKPGMWRVTDRAGDGTVRVRMGRMPVPDYEMWDALERARVRYGG